LAACCRLARSASSEGAGPPGGESIVSAMRVRSGLKTAYDEDLRQLAPGVVLEAEIVRALHETRFAEPKDVAGKARGLRPAGERGTRPPLPAALLQGEEFRHLRLDGRVVAASLALVCGGTAMLLKTAYDEDLRQLASRPVGEQRRRRAARGREHRLGDAGPLGVEVVQHR
jgi:hypothetical protein